MRCTNNGKRKGFILLPVMMIALFLGGCSNEELLFPYDTYSGFAAFSISSQEESGQARGFAADLAVAGTDQIDETVGSLPETEAAVLLNLSQKSVLYAKNAHKKLYPASLTKVMTALIAIQQIESGSIRLTDQLTASSNVLINESGAQLCGFKPGDQVTLEQALHGLLMYSGNDAGVLIAEYIGGSIENFNQKMNETALKLGATNTRFMNPHGLNDENHYTTAYDLYLIFQEAAKYPRFLELIGKTEYTFTYRNKEGKPKERSFNTTNQYLQGNTAAPEGVTVLGGKTGTTKAAGSCLILLSKSSSEQLYVSVLLKSVSREVLYTDMTKLLERIQN